MPSEFVVLAFAMLMACTACSSRTHDAGQSAELGIGRPASASSIDSWDGDIAIDGTGLPRGSGTPLAGERVFATQCVACHVHGAGLGRLRTSWPYATALFDYIRRAMPPDRRQPLSANDVYAVSAFVLAESGIIGASDIVDRETLPRVIMPGKASFRRADGTPLP